MVKNLAPEAEDLELINRFTRRPFQAAEVYTFSAVLCDNEIDRDGERFTVEALEELAGLFIGKTGIFDHEASGKNQTARIYAAEVLRQPDRRTKAGEEYSCLKAKAYMVRGEKNAELIAEIDGGIKKEVSVSCAVAEACCSICGKNLRKESCAHRKGQFYGGKLCHVVLSKPTDAYEWSFVAVPAQIHAGVVKQFHGMEHESSAESRRGAEEIVKSLREGNTEALSSTEARALAQHLDKLEKAAELGAAYRRDLQREVRRLAFLAECSLDAEVVQSVTEKMEIEELKAFRQAYEMRLDSMGAGAPVQLARPSGAESAPEEFKIQGGI